MLELHNQNFLSLIAVAVPIMNKNLLLRIGCISNFYDRIKF